MYYAADTDDTYLSLMSAASCQDFYDEMYSKYNIERIDIMKNITAENLTQSAEIFEWGFPGGSIEIGEKVEETAIREVKEETGLTIREPKLCGVKQFQTDQDERYIVLLFKTDKFEGTLISSAEGEMSWIDRNSLNDYALVNDFMELLKVFDSDCYSEFMYERNKSSDDDWLIRLY